MRLEPKRPNDEPAPARERLNRANGIPVRLVGSPSGPRATGDDQRLRAALSDHFRSVWRLLRRLGVQASAADDATQHVFLTFAARLHEITVGRERTFLIGLCPGVAANVRRHQQRDPTTLQDSEHADSEGLTPEDLLVWKQRRAVLDAALGTLSFEQRTVFVLFELEGFSLPEVATALNIPLGTATSRLRRARVAFEEWVQMHDTRRSHERP